MTLTDVGKILGVTYEAVRQIENRALAKVRRELERRGIEAEDVRELLANRESVATAWREAGE